MSLAKTSTQQQPVPEYHIKTLPNIVLQVCRSPAPKVWQPLKDSSYCSQVR
jgi:hypothetical protein